MDPLPSAPFLPVSLLQTPYALNAIIQINPNVMALAAAADAERTAACGGTYACLGMMHGVPIIVKDNVNVQGTRTTAGEPPTCDPRPVTCAL